MSLSKADILGADDLPKQDVPVPEWGGSVFVRTMTGTERDAFEADMVKRRSRGTEFEDIRSRFAVLTLADESGQQLFTDADMAALAKKSGAALDRVLAAGQELNHFSDKDVEDLAKNSGAAPSGDSGSS